MAVQDLIKSFAPESTKSSYARFSALPVAFAVLLVGCEAQNIDRRDPASAGSSLNSETQVITQTDSNNQRVAQVSVPSGALAANQQLSIEPGFHTDTAEIHSEFNIGTDNEITPAGVATVVSSNIDSNLATPMTIALDLPVSGAGLLGLFVDRHFFVVYTVRDSVAKAWKRGIVPSDSITIADNKLTFTTNLVGKYEVFQASKPIDPPKTERIVSEPELVAPPVSVSKVTPLVANADQVVTLRGKYFTDNTTVSIGNLKVGSVKVVSSNQLTFHMPDIYGLRTITVAEATNTATAEVIGRSTRIDRPVIGLTLDKVCSGISYYDHQGKPQDGSRRCDYEACDKDGGTDCVANATYPAVQKTKIVSDNLREGVTIAGVHGNVTKYDNCTADAQMGCITTGAFKAADMDIVKNYNIKSTVTIAGVTGVVQTYEACDTDGEIGCVATATFKAADMNKVRAFNIKTGVTIAGVAGNVPVYGDCGADGDTGCVANAAFKAADMTKVTEGNIKNGITIAGVMGTLERPKDCDGDGEIDCVTSMSFRAADHGNFTHSDIKSGKTIAGVAGSLANCNTDNGIDCVANPVYPSIEKAKFTPGNIRIGETIAGVEGKFPSATHRLTGYQESTAQLTSGTIEETLASSAAFQFWDAAGTLQTSAGSANLRPENIRNGVKIFKATGAIRTRCRNAGTTGSTGYENTDDEDLPQRKPWEEEHFCAENVWVDKTKNGTQYQACTVIDDNCMWQDTITQMYWAGNSKDTAKTWQDATTHCNDLQASGFDSGWRLPTQKELMTAYTHGALWIAGSNDDLKGSTKTYWSSTASSADSGSRYTVQLRTGAVSAQTTDQSIGTVCVHD